MLALLLSLPALATDHYVCNCIGADADCEPGDDKADGTSPETAWQTYERARSAFPSLKAGDSVLFCSGGGFEPGIAARWIGPGCEAKSPCTIGAYAPPWASGDEDRPRLRQQNEGSAFSFIDPEEANHEEGIVLEGLHLSCEGCTDGGARGIALGNDVDHVVLRDLIVEGFDVGISIEGTGDCDPADKDCDGLSEEITVANNVIRDNFSFGMQGGANGLVVANNTFSENGSTNGDANLWLNASQAPTNNVRIVSNTFAGSAPDDKASCTQPHVRAEALYGSLLFEGNLFSEKIGQATQGCDGVVLAPELGKRKEGFNNVRIRRNTLENLGAMAIGATSCVDCVIENNLIVNGQAHDTVAISIPAGPRSDEDLAMDAVTIRNNTVVTSSNGTGIVLNGEGGGHILVSNIVLYQGLNEEWNCFDANLPTDSYEAFDYNLCWFPNVTSGAEWNDSWGTNPSPLEAWQASSGLGTNSVWTTPGLAKDWQPQDELSAVVGAGHPTLSSEEDIRGYMRFDADMGAYEYGAKAPDTGDTDIPDDTGPTPDDSAAPGGDDGAGDDGGGGDGGDDKGCGCAATSPVSAAWLFALALVLAGRRD